MPEIDPPSHRAVRLGQGCMALHPKRPSDARLLLLLLCLCLGCAPKLPAAFVAERDLAHEAYSCGQYRLAALRWQRARSLAPNARERAEATYRMAASFERAKMPDRAEALYAELAVGDSERAARAAYQHALLALSRGAQSLGRQRLRQAILRFPNAGPARRATVHLLNDLQKREGQARALTELDWLLGEVGQTELQEFLLFEQARRAEELGALARARALYLGLAQRFPYPRGVFWDDSVLAAARIEVSFGHFQEAIRLLEGLLAVRETARLTGSYERKSYAEARFLIAEIYRDHLLDADRARRAFRRVLLEHPTSRLGDDALFQEALVALGQGDQAGACEAAELLIGQRPESRFAPCMKEACPRTKPGHGSCRSTFREQIQRARQRAEAGYSSSSSR